MAEGVWGDHIVLRAICNVLGYVVKVLNVSDKTERWTELEPVVSCSKNSDIHIILGHVGEFHYTSLRPTGSVYFIQLCLRHFQISSLFT